MLINVNVSILLKYDNYSIYIFFYNLSNIFYLENEK